MTGKSRHDISNTGSYSIEPINCGNGIGEHCVNLRSDKCLGNSYRAYSSFEFADHRQFYNSDQVKP